MRALAAEQPDSARWRRDLYAGLFRIGNVRQAQDDLAEARGLHQEGLDTIRALVSQDPWNIEWQRDVWASLIKLGEVLEDEGDIAGAVARYREGLAVMRALASKDPDNTRWQTDTAASLVRLAFADDDARGRCREALAMLERLRSQDRLEPAQVSLIDLVEAKLAELPKD